MFGFCFALSKEHLERPVSGMDCPDALSARFRKAKQQDPVFS